MSTTLEIIILIIVIIILVLEVYRCVFCCKCGSGKQNGGAGRENDISLQQALALAARAQREAGIEARESIANQYNDLDGNDLANILAHTTVNLRTGFVTYHGRTENDDIAKVTPLNRNALAVLLNNHISIRNMPVIF